MKYIYCLLFLSISVQLTAQENANELALDDFGRIGFFTDVIQTDDDFEGRALTKVKRGLERMLLKESLGKSTNERFGLVAMPVIYSKEKTSTTPPKYFYEFGIDLIAIDYQEKTKFGVFSFDNLRGMNVNSQRALMSGLKAFKSSKAFSLFLSEVKNKIIDYYESNCDFILKDAETKASNDDFEESLAVLASVPSVCKTCYDTAQEKSVEVYLNKLERECQSIVAEANSFIASESWEDAAKVLRKVLPGISCHSEAVTLMEKVENHWCSVNLGKAKAFQQSKNFDQAAAFLALIPTSSACGDDADMLGKNIYGELSAIEKRDWEFKMEQYGDAMRIEQRSFDFSVNKFERTADRQDKALNNEDKRLNKEIDNSLEVSKLKDKRLNKALDNKVAITKIINTANVEMAKANANKTTTTIDKRDYSWLNE
jgi:hypothetical protein